MYEKIEQLVENAFKSDIPDNTAAFSFNIYEDADDMWSVELIAAASFDADDEDWACDEISDLGTREEPVSWHEKTDWESVLSAVVTAVKEYLDKGKYSEKMKEYKGVGVGFVDGDIELVYIRD